MLRDTLIQTLSVLKQNLVKCLHIPFMLGLQMIQIQIISLQMEMLINPYGANLILKANKIIWSA